jgi:Zn-dependent M28 family amino/carboxypeptidase
VVGGHIDSWDVGQGAHDDGGGVVAAWQAVTLMKQLGLRPRRTVRVVAWTNEENGGRGNQAYLASLGTEVRNHVAAIEMDDGVESPLGFRFQLNNSGPETAQYAAARTKLLEIVKLLDGIGANTIIHGDGGADVTPLMRQGVPVLGLLTTMEHYFDWHHTNADTLDKVDIQVLRRCIATLAVTSYVLADMPGTLVERSEVR